MRNRYDYYHSILYYLKQRYAIRDKQQAETENERAFWLTVESDVAVDLGQRIIV